MTEHTIEIIELSPGFDIDGYVYDGDEVVLAYSAEAGLTAIPGAVQPADEQLQQAVHELIDRGIWPLPDPEAGSNSSTEVPEQVGLEAGWARTRRGALVSDDGYRREDYPPAKEAISLLLRFQRKTEQQVRIEVADTVVSTRAFLQALWDSLSPARRAWLEQQEDTKELRILIGIGDTVANLGTAIPGAEFNYVEAAMWMIEY